MNENLDMAKWVPKFLNAYQKSQSCQFSKKLCKFFGAFEINSSRDSCPWSKSGYITATRIQGNNDLSGGIEAHLA